MDTPNQGNDFSTNVDTVVQESCTIDSKTITTDCSVDDEEIRPQLFEPSQSSNEIQVWTESFEQKNNDRIMKMREEMENKLDAVLKAIKTNRSASTEANPRSQKYDTKNFNRQDLELTSL